MDTQPDQNEKDDFPNDFDFKQQSSINEISN
jgi:hypothetical protein